MAPPPPNVARSGGEGRGGAGRGGEGRGGAKRGGEGLVESFTGVIGRAGLDQGRGVLSRVTSASMLLVNLRVS